MSKPDVQLCHRDPQRQQLFERVFDRLAEISSLPDVANHVAMVASDPESDAEDLLNAVQGDPALAARIMRSVNSAFYGLRQPARDLKTAITLLGFKEVRNLALTVYVAEMFRQDDGFGPYNREQLWQHLVGVATASRLIGRLCRSVAPEEAYLAGLLHDLGIILIDQHLPRHFRRIIMALSEQVPLCEAERTELEFDHTELGAHVAKKWGFPESTCAAIRFHHTPDACQGELRPLVQTVTLANYLCSRTGLTSMGMHNIEMPPDSCFVELEISEDQLSLIWQELEPALEDAAVLVAI